MSIWDTLRRLLGQEPKPATTSQQIEKPRPSNTVVLAAETEPNNDLPVPGDVPVDLFTLLFNSNDKHLTTMLNSISLSTDMKTLYLIDNGRVISYDLTVPEGVLVGMLGEQLVVATGVTPAGPLSDEEPSGGDSDTPTLETDSANDTSDLFTVKIIDKSQFTLTYNGSNDALAIIGVDDITLHLTADGGGDIDCSKAAFSLKSGKIVRVKVREDELSIETI